MGAGACLPCYVSLAGIAVCCLTLERSQGACGQLQPVPELQGLPPGPGPLLRLERLEVCVHQPLPTGGGLQVRAYSGPFPLSLLAHPPPSVSALDPLWNHHTASFVPAVWASFLFNNCIYLFLTMLGLCCSAGVVLVVASGGCSNWCTGFSLQWLLLLGSTGFSSCSSQAPEHRLRSCGAQVASQQVRRSWTRD